MEPGMARRQSEVAVEVPFENVPLRVLGGLLDAWVEERPQFDWDLGLAFHPSGVALRLTAAAIPPPWSPSVHEGAVHRYAGRHLRLGRQLGDHGLDGQVGS